MKVSKRKFAIRRQWRFGQALKDQVFMRNAVTEYHVRHEITVQTHIGCFIIERKYSSLHKCNKRSDIRQVSPRKRQSTPTQ